MKMKGVDAVARKSMARKRGADENLGMGARKKVKGMTSEVVTSIELTSAAESKLEEEKDKEKNQGHGPEKVFRFMDLPGELRNRIYEHAIEYSQRCFPPLYPKDKSRSNSRSTSRPSPRSSRSSTSIPDNPRLPLPHIGLTQTSSQLRFEFRPAWLSTHKIPLSLLPSYLKAFYPIIKLNTSTSLRTRLESQFSPTGHLRLLLRDSELSTTDLISIIRHSVRYPQFTLTTISMPGTEASTTASIQSLITNKTEAWVRDVAEKRVTQVRIMMVNRRRPTMRIVVKERWAEEWMREGITKYANSEEFVRSRGLEGIAEMWQIGFGVDYS